MRIKYFADLKSSFHHGADTKSGNTSLLRTQEVVQPDGTLAHVPFLSANSIRHGLRSALAWHVAKTLDFQPGTLTKNEVALLWSGGAVTKTGAQVNLELARQANELLPMLGLLGYAAGSDIVAGTLRVSDAILACTENEERLYTPIPDLKPAAHYRGEEFGTRQDLDTTPTARFIGMAADQTQSTQMIYSVQTLKPGATLVGDMMTDAAATDAHKQTLAAAWHLWAPGGVTYLGAKTATGYGQAHLVPDQEVPDEVPWLTGHLMDYADDIPLILAELAA